MIFKEYTEPLEMLCKNLDYIILFRKTTELQELRLKCKWKKIQQGKAATKRQEGQKHWQSKREKSQWSYYLHC